MAKTTIVDVDPREMSFIRNEYKGERWSTVNGDAVVLTVKGEKPGLADRVKGAIDTLKALLGTDEADADYTERARAILYAAADMQRASELAEPERSKAMKAAIDSVEKAGRRHSAMDMENLEAIRGMAQELNQRLASLGVGDLEGETVVGDEPVDNPDAADLPGDGDGDADDVAVVDAKDERGTGEYKGDKEGKYGDVAYADEKNKKYPIDTEEHARAAWSYINQEKNASEYDSEDLAKIKARIEAACKKFGIEISKAEPVNIEEVVKGQVQALITAKAAEFEQQIATVKSEAQSQIDTLKAESESRVAQLEAQLQEVTQRAQEAEAVVKAVVADASKPSSPGFVPTMREDGKRSDPAAEVTKAEAIQSIGKPSTIAEVIKLQQLLRQ